MYDKLLENRIVFVAIISDDQYNKTVDEDRLWRTLWEEKVLFQGI